ncbi:hypothetical protein ACO0QE_000329 [Hanseniaspora vineae]
MNDERLFCEFLKKRARTPVSNTQVIDAVCYYIPKTRHIEALQLYVNTLWQLEFEREHERELLLALHDRVRYACQLKFEICEPFITIESFVQAWMDKLEATADQLKLPQLLLTRLLIISAVSCAVNTTLVGLKKSDVIASKNVYKFQKLLFRYFTENAFRCWNLDKSLVSFVLAITPVYPGKLTLATRVYVLDPRVALCVLESFIIPYFATPEFSTDFKETSNIVQRYLSTMVSYIDTTFQEHPTSRIKQQVLQTVISHLTCSNKSLENDYVLALVLILNTCYDSNLNDQIVTKLHSNFDTIIATTGKFAQFTELFRTCSHNIKDLRLVEKLTLPNPSDNNDLFMLDYLQYAKPQKSYLPMLATYCTSKSLPTSLKEAAHLAMLHMIQNSQPEIGKYLENVILVKQQYKQLTENQLLIILNQTLPQMDSIHHISDELDVQLALLSDSDPASLLKLIKFKILTLVRMIALGNLSDTAIIDFLNNILKLIERYPEKHVPFEYLWKELISNKENWYYNEIGIRWWYTKVMTSKL